MKRCLHCAFHPGDNASACVTESVTSEIKINWSGETERQRERQETLAERLRELVGDKGQITGWITV